VKIWNRRLIFESQFLILFFLWGIKNIYISRVSCWLEALFNRNCDHILNFVIIDFISFCNQRTSWNISKFELIFQVNFSWRELVLRYISMSLDCKKRILKLLINSCFTCLSLFQRIFPFWISRNLWNSFINRWNK